MHPLTLKHKLTQTHESTHLHVPSTITLETFGNQECEGENDSWMAEEEKKEYLQILFREREREKNE